MEKEGTVPDDAAVVSALQAVPTAVASDAMGRTNAMAAAVRPLFEGVRLCGPAVTVAGSVGSNEGAIRALDAAGPGDVIVIDARGHTDAAVWGGVLCALARRRRVAGVVVDGAIRDAAEQRACGFPVFSRAVVPAGPPRPGPDRVNVGIVCGGVHVEPGDLILGDDDGVVVIPRSRAREVLERSRELLAREEEWLAMIERGESPFPKG
jgi:4-hydroxy-4-methyl-2-oxoglutarate aldolase